MALLESWRQLKKVGEKINKGPAQNRLTAYTCLMDAAERMWKQNPLQKIQHTGDTGQTYIFGLGREI